MLPVDPSEQLRLTAALYLRALLPALPVLAEVDPVAARLIAGACPGACLLSVDADREAPAAGLLFDGEGLHPVGGDHPDPELRLRFADVAALVHFFGGRGRGVPRCAGLLRRPDLAARLAGLLLRLKAVLEPGPTAGLDVRSAQAYLLLNFAVMAGALPALAEAVPGVRRHLAAGPGGLAVLRVDESRCPRPFDPRVWVQVLEDGRVAAGLVAPSRPANVEIRFADPWTAVRNLRREEDPQAAVTRRRITLAGRVPLADSLNALFDALARLLPAR